MATKFLDKHVTLRLSRKASETLTKYRLVEINASDHEQIDQADAANDKCLGVVAHDAEAGDEMSVECGGILAIEAGDTVGLHDELVSDSSGRVVARGTDEETLYNVVGRAVTQAAVGELCMVAWNPYTTWGANTDPT
jgi:hypothetical protein